MKKKTSDIKPVEKKLALEALYKSAENVAGPRSTAQFIGQLLTENEKIILGRRILIAQMILAGETRMEIQNV